MIKLETLGLSSMDRDNLIVQHFRYLIDDYGFRVYEHEFVHQTFGNAFVIFKSSLTGIEIVIDRNQAFIMVSPAVTEASMRLFLGATSS